MPDSVRDVSRAVVGSVLRNRISSFQAQALRLLRPNTGFFLSVPILHGERLPWTLFRSDNHAVVSCLLCTLWNCLWRLAVHFSTQANNVPRFNPRPPTHLSSLHNF